MLQLLTSGISVSVKVFFEGTYFKNYNLNYSYAYQIIIQNQGKEAVQLQSRHWVIIDSLRPQTIIDGEGVVGKKPVINPGEIHKYKSGCLLSSAVGAMNGAYIMIDFSSTKKFNVEIPPFKLSAPFVLN